MANKPHNLSYGVNDRPPIWVTFLLALQHIFVLSSTILFPAVLIEAIGGTYLQINSLIAFSMIAAAIGTVVQALRWGPLGSGYLVPNLCGPAYLSVSLQAAWLGGLPLMHGMILVGGVFEAIFSQVIHHLRKLFPPEVVGLVVLMVGISLIPLAASKFVGVEYVGGDPSATYLILSVVILFLMIGINIWAKPGLKLYGVLIGMVVGYILSLAFGLIPDSDIQSLAKADWLAVPGKGVHLFQFRFEPSLILPFIIVSVVGALKTFGNLSTAQKINDADWQEPDTKNISRGLLADSISVIMAGLLGGMATDSSSSNVGLSLATGATSRVIAFAIGILFVFFAFSPKITGLFAIMPGPVMGAILVFVTSFMVLSGFQIILHTQPDTKKIFIVGIAFIFGLSSAAMSSLYSFVPDWLGIIFASPLTLATLIAIVLNVIFNFTRLFGR